MDRLEHIFILQHELDQKLIDERKLGDITSEEWVQKIILAMIAELGELLHEVNFKWWKNEKPINKQAIREELVDIMHFFTSMCLKMGMSPEELYQDYLAKNQENIDRQDGKSSKLGYCKKAE